MQKVVSSIEKAGFCGEGLEIIRNTVQHPRPDLGVLCSMVTSRSRGRTFQEYTGKTEDTIPTIPSPFRIKPSARRRPTCY